MSLSHLAPREKHYYPLDNGEHAARTRKNEGTNAIERVRRLNLGYYDVRNLESGAISHFRR